MTGRKKSTDDSLNEPFEQDSTAADDESVLDKFVDDGENGGKKPKSTTRRSCRSVRWLL